MSSLARLAEFIYIFNKYRDVAEKSIREYMEYFATRKPSSPETKKIDRMVKWYQTDNETRKRYMTWQQEIDIAVDQERQRANDAEKRFFEARDRANDAEKRFFEARDRANDAERRYFEAKDRADEIQKQVDAAEARADEIQKQADAEKARADKYEKMLRDLGKL